MKIPKDIADKFTWQFKLAGEPLQYPYVKKIKPIPEVCEDCYDVVVDRHIDCQKTKQGWAIKCRACKRYRNPETGEFDLTNTQLRNCWKENKKTK